MASTRINKYLADHQYASRREADRLIEAGFVYINGRVAELGDQVKQGDKVEVKGKQSEKKVYYIFNKPVGVVTVGAQRGEKEIKDLIKTQETVYPVGRLDKDSEGLIILTNDGRVTSHLLGPENQFEKEYEVRVNKPLTHQFLARMKSGVEIRGVGKGGRYKTKPALVKRVSPKVFHIVLTEGKNRQIRRMCAAFHYDVLKLRRFRIENLALGNLKKGEVKELKGKQLNDFLKIIGIF